MSDEDVFTFISEGESVYSFIEEGPKGNPGDSAYELAVAQGFQGALEEWLESLRGEDGSDGIGQEAIDAAVAVEAALRADADAQVTADAQTALDAAIADVNATYATQLALAAETSARQAAIEAEQSDRLAGDDTLQDAIDANAQAWANAISELLGGAPAASLDTIAELAQALTDNDSEIAGIITALAGKQPLASTLSALAALSTTTIGRSLLEAANASGLRAILLLGTAATHAHTDYDSAGAADAAVAAHAALDRSGDVHGLGGELDAIDVALAAKVNVTDAVEGAFSAYRHAALNIGGGTALACDSENFDISGWFDATTGRYTPQKPGLYRLSASALISSVAAGKNTWIVLYRNGAVFKYGGLTPGASATGSHAPAGSWLVQANGTDDYFEIFLFCGDTVARPLAAVDAGNHFAGELVGELTA